MKPCIIFLGPPGAGKGSQTEKLKAHLNYETVSTGDLVRAQIKAQSQIGLKIEPFLKEGKLVPDELIIQLFKEWILDNKNAKGFILDGFPRTIEQAKVFNRDIVESLSLDVKVLSLEVSVDLLISRMLSRIICSNCKAVYNLNSKPPKKDGICDLCGSKLERRHDDQPETIKIRNTEYLNLTAPLSEFYSKALIKVNGNQSSEQVFNDILASL